MTQYRVERLQGVIQAELSDIIRTSLKDPRVGFVSVTGVEVSNDLRHAKAFVSVMGDQSEQEETLATLNRAAGFIRSEIGKRIRLRHCPEIIFRLDKSIEHGSNINALLRKLQSGAGKDVQNGQ
ncbi:MAG: 30S ribosome-binding factor RbfA [Firmicutes bacterium]|nr:30S ribosome-binding factor RbfA [Bacillota bacterium]